MMTHGMGARGALSADMAGHLEVEFQSPLVSATTPPGRSLCPRSRFEMEPPWTSVNSLIAAMVIVWSGDAPPPKWNPVGPTQLQDEKYPIPCACTGKVDGGLRPEEIVDRGRRRSRSVT